MDNRNLSCRVYLLDDEVGFCIFPVSFSAVSY